MDYSVKKTKKLWGVYEHQTNQFIKTFPQKKEAIEYMSFLTKGGAFDGFTPSFMLKSVSNTNP